MVFPLWTSFLGPSPPPQSRRENRRRRTIAPYSRTLFVLRAREDGLGEAPLGFSAINRCIRGPLTVIGASWYSSARPTCELGVFPNTVYGIRSTDYVLQPASATSSLTSTSTVRRSVRNDSRSSSNFEISSSTSWAISSILTKNAS